MDTRISVIAGGDAIRGCEADADWQKFELWWSRARGVISLVDQGAGTASFFT